MLIVLNHKMNLKIDEAKKYEESIRDMEVIVMPQTPFLGLFTNAAKYTLGSQCVSEYNAPGGVSPEALASMNCKYVIVGHAERRIVRKEDCEVVARKVIEVVNNEMIPIMCIGENLEEKNNNQTLEVLENQISNVFEMIEGCLGEIMIAYEPVWSIGTDKLPSNEEIAGLLEFIKIICKEKYNLNPTLFYGGSINASNIDEIKQIPNLGGIVVGNASLDLDQVKRIYNSVKGTII